MPRKVGVVEPIKKIYVEMVRQIIESEAEHNENIK